MKARAKSALAAFRARIPLLYCAGLLALGCALLALRPIVNFDSDLWYHLAGGRMILRSGSIPTETWFSFIRPARRFVDYYWLFQVLVYSVYRLSGFYGLLALRTAAFAATGGLGLAWLFGPEAAKRAPASYRTFLYSVFLTALAFRAASVRPHVVEYACAMAFIFVLESRPSWAPILPFIAVLWANFHGVSYPLELWIAGSYAADYYAARWLRSRAREGLTERTLAWIALSMAAVFATPHGWRLVDVPFAPIGYVRQVVSEMRPFRAEDYYSFSVLRGELYLPSLLPVVLGASALSFGIGASRLRLRLAHVLLWAGGLVLLQKANRFLFDATLLSLPLLAANPLWSGPDGENSRLHPAARAVLILVLAALPVRSLLIWIPRGDRYPLADVDMPAGSARFLEAHAATGRILAEPVQSGYLEWAAPGLKVFVDMENSYVFTEDDLFTTLRAFAHADELSRLLSRYRPDWVLLPFAKTDAREALPSKDWAPVFFDEGGVLFASRVRQPRMASEWELKAVEPFSATEDVQKWLDSKSGSLAGLEELRRVVEADPERPFARELKARLEMKLGMPSAGLADALLAARSAPDVPRTTLLVAEALLDDRRPASALEWFRRGLELLEGDQRGLAWRGMGRAEAQMGRWQDAYADLKRSVAVWESASSKDFADYLEAADRSGHEEEARAVRELAAAHGLGEADGGAGSADPPGPSLQPRSSGRR